jgi:hypothetical protein
MRIFAVLLALAAAIAGPALAAVPAIHSDSGSSERTWSSNTNPGTEQVTFVWHPQRPIGTTFYVGYGECSRSDDTGEPRGNHKVVFKNLELRGVDSDNVVGLPTRTETVRNGAQVNLAFWDLTPVRDDFASDSSVIVTGKIQVKKKIAATDILACDLGVVELLETGAGALKSTEARLEHIHRLDAAGLLGKKLAGALRRLGGR